jgi:hypothetical protein
VRWVGSPTSTAVQFRTSEPPVCEFASHEGYLDARQKIPLLHYYHD